MGCDISSKNPLRVSVAGHSAPKTRTFEDRRPVRGLVPAGMPKFQILGSGTALDEDTDAAVDMSGSRPGSPLTPAANASEAADQAETQSVAVEIGDMRARRMYSCTSDGVQPNTCPRSRCGNVSDFGTSWMRAGASVRFSFLCGIEASNAFCRAMRQNSHMRAKSIILRVTVQEFLQAQPVIHYSCTSESCGGLDPSSDLGLLGDCRSFADCDDSTWALEFRCASACRRLPEPRHSAGSASLRHSETGRFAVTQGNSGYSVAVRRLSTPSKMLQYGPASPTKKRPANATCIVMSLAQLHALFN